MINLGIIDGEIASLKEKQTSYDVIERLAWLYIVKDHLGDNSTAQHVVVAKTASIEPTQPVSATASDFVRVASEKDSVKLIKVLDEHMEVIKFMHPKEYTALMEKIKAI